MSAQDQLRQLISRLAYGTETGVVAWTSTDREAAYQYSTADGSILIFSEDDDGESPYQMAILDASGTTVESIRTTVRTRQEGDRTIRTAAAWNAALADLYALARRNAHNVDGLIRDLIAELPAPPADEPPF